MSTEMKVDSSLLVIKGRFKAMGTSSYGLFILFLDNLSKNADKFDVVSSHFSTLYENNTGMPWNEMEDIITKLKWKGEYATSLTHDIQASIEDIMQPGTGRSEDIFSNIKKAQINKVTAIFEEALGRPTGDKNVKCDISVETVQKIEIEAVTKARKERESKEMLNADVSSRQEEPGVKSTTTDQSTVIIEVSLVLSPISGIPIYELKEGDKIMIKITEQSNRGQYYIDLLNASSDNEVIPIPATVVKVTKEGKIYTVLATLGPGIYGRSIDEDTVKIKKYDPSQDKKKKSDAAAMAQETTPKTATAAIAQESKKEKGPFSMIFLIIGAAAILMLAIMIFMFVL